MRIHVLDLDFQNVPQTVASYLVEGSDGCLLIETGPASTLQTLLERLRDHGLEAGDIRHILLTHIHLDHAGAAGWWSRQGAQIHVHPVGAPHLIDPGRLLSSASRIYGDRMQSLWGETEPARAEKVTVVQDGERLELCGLEIEAYDTPGHARHHLVYRIGDIGFMGDAAGLRLPAVDLVDLPAPPPEFNREEWQSTIGRLEGLDLRIIYPTHFGCVEDPARHFAELRNLLDDAIYFVASCQSEGASRDEIVKEYRHWNATRAREAGLSEAQIRQYATANPLDMSVDGILRYLRKREITTPAS